MTDKHIFLWKLIPGERVSKGIAEGIIEFEADLGERAEFVFVHEMPRKKKGEPDRVQEGEAIVDGAMLIQAGWVPKGQVVISGMRLGFEGMR